MRLAVPYFSFAILFVGGLFSCAEQKEHTAEAVNEKDSVAAMVSYGINTLISDSGVMRYRIVAERWEVNEVKRPPRWHFQRGIFMEQFDENFRPEAYIQSDTAHYYNVDKLWHLTGNVRVKTVEGLRFNSEELYWDQNRHEMYSYRYSTLVTPERSIEGNYFVSDERMQHYTVTQTNGSFMRKSETTSQQAVPAAPGDTSANEQSHMRSPAARPMRKR